jgi:hypothetical protein
VLSALNGAVCFDTPCVGSLPLGQHGMFNLLAKLHPPSTTIKLKVSPSATRTCGKGGESAADSAQSPLAFSLKAMFDHYAIGPVAQWIRHRPTELGIAGSSPAGVNDLVNTSIVTMPKLRILGGGKWALGGGLVHPRARSLV